MQLCTHRVLGAILLLLLPASLAAAQSAPVPDALDRAEKDAVLWIMGQMVPNDTVPAPASDRRRLLLSYQVPKDDPAYRYVYGRSFIYDDALGAIALTMLGRYREAEFLLNSLSRLVRPDGSLWFAYNTQNDWPSEKDNGGALVRTGAVAWVGYALTYYLGVRSQGQSDFATNDVLGRQYREAAESIGRFIVSRQLADAAGRSAGLVTGGSGSTLVVRGAADKDPREAYDAAPVGWASTEHNIDAWFFLRDLGRVTGTETWSRAADRIRGSLIKLWAERAGQYYQGFLDTGLRDRVLPLDGATWGSLYLLALDRPADAEQCLFVLDERFGSADGGVRGYRPYGPEPVYGDPRVGAYYFPDAPRRLWQDVPIVWGEGSLGAAAALIRAGKRDAGAAVITALLPLQVAGGVRYASRPIAYQFNDYPSVASTAWFIIAVEMLRNTPAAAAFWGR